MQSVSNSVGTKLLFENDRIRVWEMRLEPGQSCELHQHVNDYVFVNLTRAQVELLERGNEPLSRSLDEGFVQYTVVGRDGQPAHVLRNAGASELRQILIEFIGKSVALQAQEPESNSRFL